MASLAKAEALSPLTAVRPRPFGCQTVIMTVARRSLSLPAFSEPATDAPAPGRPGGRRLLPVEQGADFRQPPGEAEPAPAPARRPLAAGGITFSDPDRQI